MDVPSLTTVHNNLAKRIKEYEQRTREFPPVEVLNELRYALRAALELCLLVDSSDVDQNRRGELVQRINHALLCGYHDLVDGTVVETVRIIDKLIADYPGTYDVAGERITQIHHVAKTVEEKIAESRGEPAQRKRIYASEVYEQWFDSLVDGLAYIKHIAVPLIVKHDDRQRKRETRNRIVAWLGVAVGIVGMAIAVFQ